MRKIRDCAACDIGLYARPDAQFQLNTVSDGDVMRLMRYLFHYCDHKKRSFQSTMHQKPSGGRAPPGPAGELERSPDLAVLGVGWDPRRGGRGSEGEEGRE